MGFMSCAILGQLGTAAPGLSGGAPQAKSRLDRKQVWDQLVVPAISTSGGWGPGCQVPAHLAPGLPAFDQGLEGLGLGECSGPGFPCRAWDGRHGGHTPRGPSPVDKVEVLLQEAGVHGALAELQPRLRVVVHVVDAHLFQDPKAPLPGGEDAHQH